MTLLPILHCERCGCELEESQAGMCQGCRDEESAAEQGLTLEQYRCRHDWNQSAAEADESGGRIYCVKCGVDGDA